MTIRAHTFDPTAVRDRECDDCGMSFDVEALDGFDRCDECAEQWAAECADELEDDQ